MTEFVKANLTAQKKLEQAYKVNPEFKPTMKQLMPITDFQCHVQLLDLLAEACLGRNSDCQKDVGFHFDQPKLMMLIIEQKTFSFEIRSRILKLFLTVYLDRDPFQPLAVPSETMIWNSLPKLDFYGAALIASI